jgi:hypothetical protein
MPKKLPNLLAGKLSKSGFMQSGLTKKAEPPPTRGSRKTKAAGDGGWLRRLVRPLVCHKTNHHFIKNAISTTDTKATHNTPANLTPNVVGSLMLPL